jgi:hypothetical protein
MTIKDFYADRIFDFIKKHAPYVIDYAKKQSKTPAIFIKDIIKKHMDYKTIVCVWDQGEIVGVGTFNIEDTTVKVIECVVNPKYRFKNILKKLTGIGFEHWPHVRTLEFQRSQKNDGSWHRIDILKFLKIPAVQ